MSAAALLASASGFSLEPQPVGLCCPYLMQVLPASSLEIPSRTHPEVFPWRPVRLTMKFNHHTLFTHIPFPVLSARIYFAPQGHVTGQGWITRDNSRVTRVPLDREELPSNLSLSPFARSPSFQHPPSDLSHLPSISTHFPIKKSTPSLPLPVTSTNLPSRCAYQHLHPQQHTATAHCPSFTARSPLPTIRQPPTIPTQPIHVCLLITSHPATAHCPLPTHPLLSVSHPLPPT